jgi:hypothetical protein
MVAPSLWHWIALALATGVALAAALAFYPALRLTGRGRTLACLVCSAAVGVSPCLIPLEANPLRFLASLFAITLLVKLYDLHRSAPLALRLSLWGYLAYLPNGFWLVLRREPSRPPMPLDLRRLGFRAPAALASVLLCVGLYRVNWSTVWFPLEHVLKVAAVASAVVLLTKAAAAASRLLGGVALDFMNNPLVAPTPADFWRRWNVPAQQFLNEYTFQPAGGPRRAVRATLVTFAVSGLVHEYVFGVASGRVQGWQLLFFMLQGVAVVATMRIRPRGRITLLWVAGTWVFNLASSALFFLSVNQVLPFYRVSDS